MLILTRKIGQSIKIGDSISVTVVSLRGEQVRLGIDAPKDIPVDREEVAERRAVRGAPGEGDTGDEITSTSREAPGGSDHRELLHLKRTS